MFVPVFGRAGLAALPASTGFCVSLAEPAMTAAAGFAAFFGLLESSVAGLGGALAVRKSAAAAVFCDELDRPANKVPCLCGAGRGIGTSAAATLAVVSGE
jgi:hypothetical protein